MALFFQAVLILLLLGIFNHSLAKKRWLYNRHEITGFPGWTILTIYENGTNTKESSASTGALSVCTKNVTDQMWLISEYINLRQARQMAMSINISCVPRCVAIRFKQQGQDNALPLPNVRELNLADFIQFSTQDNSTSEKTISSAVTHNGTFVLFQTSNNNSHCLTIKSLKIHYNYCPNVSVNLAYFKETPSPPLKKNNEIDHVDVTGVCQLNAVPTNPAVRARMSCDSTGKWKFKSGCHCSAGFEMVIASCSKCKTGYFKSSPGNSSCLKCGINTETTQSATTCPCKPDHYRKLNQEQLSTADCYRIPSAPAAVYDSKLTNSSVVLSWDPPNNPGTLPITYHIRCLATSALCSSIRYDPSDANLVSKQVTLNNLRPYTTYSLEVYAYNDVTQASGKAFGQTKKITTKKGLPSEILNMKARILGNLLTILWDSPAVLGDTSVSYAVACDGYSAMNVQQKYIQVTVHSSQAGNFLRCQVRCKNSIGYGKSVVKVFQIPGGQTPTDSPSTSGVDAELKTILIVVACIVILIVIAMVVLIWVISKRRKRRNIRRGFAPHLSNSSAIPNEYDPVQLPRTRVGLYGPQPHNYTLRIPEQSVALPRMGHVNPGADIDDEAEPEYLEIDNFDYEFCLDNLTGWQVLAEGTFGVVYKATAEDICGNKGYSVVAVKMMKENARQKDIEDFNLELKLMKKLKPHPHVLRFLGCCTWKEPKCIIIEFLPHGDLQKFLRKSRGYGTDGTNMNNLHQTFLKPKQLLQFAVGIADGMAHLASHNIVHRDLACRNVLVGHKLVCKIADLGLARDVSDCGGLYQREKEARLPVKWMSPEAIFKAVSSIKSDVWAFGITFYEIVTIGDSPYPQYKSKQVMKLLEEKYRMPQPPHCADDLYAIMSSCWEENPEKRPTFTQLHSCLKQLLDKNEDHLYINLDAYKDELYVHFDSDDEETGL